MTAEIWVSLAAGTGFLITAVYVILARRRRPTWATGVILLLFSAEFIFAQSIMAMSVTPPARVFWYKMIYLGFTVVPTAFFCFALRLSGLARLLTGRVYLLLSIIPAVNFGLVVTNEAHGLVWNPSETMRIIASGGFLTHGEAGPWYFFNTIYSYLVVAAGIYNLGRLFFRSYKLHRSQVAIITIAAVLATLGTTLDILDISPLPSFLAAVLGLAIGSMTITLTISYTHQRKLVVVSSREIINCIGDAILVVDTNNRMVDINPTAEGLLGDQAAYAIGKPIQQVLPELAPFLYMKADDIGEMTLSQDDSRHTYDLRVSTINDSNGQVISRVIVLRDITDMKRAQANLRRATEEAHAIFWHANVTKLPEGSTEANGFHWDTQYLNTEQVNKFLHLHWDPSLSWRFNFYNSLNLQDRVDMDRRSAEALNSGVDGYQQEFRLTDAAGAVHWLYEDARIRRVSEGQFELDGFITDITERKTMEEALRESEDRLSVFFRNDPTGKIVINRATQRIVEANPSALEMIGLPKEAVVGKVCHGFMCHDDENQCPICDLHQVIDSSERVLIRADQTSLPILKTVIPIKFDGLDYLLENMIDISERKQAEARILESIEEKEALLKEIHHRVKNNMQVISSMMSLQAGQVKDEKLVEAFRESQNRIRSMTLVHEKLYRSENLARIRFDEYIRELAPTLVRAYSLPSRVIRLDIQAEPVQMDIDTAIPCGLILNELVTNSLKHAFPPGRDEDGNAEGIVRIHLNRLADDKIRLVVADNGTGFPPGDDFKNSGSLGLQLVNSLTYQLDGEVTFANHSGARTELIFTCKREE